MDQQSQMKVMKAGFMIIRKDDTKKPKIKYKVDTKKEWTTHSVYETKAARNRAFDLALLHDKIIQD